MTDILITSSTYPLNPTDTRPRFVLDLAKGLMPHSSTLTVLAPHAPGTKKKELMEGVQTIRYPYMTYENWQTICYNHGIPDNVKQHPIKCALQVIPFIFKQKKAILRICKNMDNPIVNSHWLIFQGLAGSIARRKLRFHHVIHVHAAGLYALQRLPVGIGRSVARYIDRGTDHYICESTYVRENLDTLLGHSSNADISCMGVNLDTFQSDAKNKTERKSNSIVFIGRLAEKKGIKYLLQAIKIIKEEINDVHLQIIGQGVLEDELKKLAKDLDILDENVSFLGAKSHNQLKDILAQCKIVTVPSIIDSKGETEGMPTVILEALAAGKYVVASKTAGAPDVITNGVNGWLCIPKNPEDLAEKLITAINCDDTTIISKALNTADHYSWPNLCKRYVQYLKPKPQT